MKKGLVYVAILVVAFVAYTYRDELSAMLQGDVALVDRTPHPFYLTGLDQRQYNLEMFKGKVVVMDVWATWCPDCVALLGKVERLNHKYADKNVVVLTMNVDTLTEGRLTPEQVRDFVHEQALTVPVLMADEEAMRAWGTSANGAGADAQGLAGQSQGARVLVELPQTYVIDQKGHIRFQSTEATPGQLQAVVNRLLKD